jgi:hypothetical protein
MTRQYLIGEMSMLLAELETAAPRHPPLWEVARLRRTAETGSPTALASVARRALDVSRALCWECLSAGDIAGFNRHAAMCVELHDFGACAGLLDDGW